MISLLTFFNYRALFPQNASGFVELNISFSVCPHWHLIEPSFTQFHLVLPSFTQFLFSFTSLLTDLLFFYLVFTALERKRVARRSVFTCDSTAALTKQFVNPIRLFKIEQKKKKGRPLATNWCDAQRRPRQNVANEGRNPVAATIKKQNNKKKEQRTSATVDPVQ